jgi:hypothetical protein
MKNYKLMLDISNVYRSIKHLKLKEYNGPFPTIFVSAKDPDDACKIAIDNLIYMIISQDPSIAMRITCRKIIKKSRIDKIYLL